MDVNKPLRFKRKASKKQQVWSYIRRNRTFRVGDVMSVLEVSRPFVKALFWHLQKVEYLRLDSDPKKYQERVYTLLRDTGAKSPSMINGVFFDYNTGERFEFNTRTPQETTDAIIEAIRGGSVKLKGIVEVSGLPRGTVFDYLFLMIRDGMIRRVKLGVYEVINE